MGRKLDHRELAGNLTRSSRWRSARRRPLANTAGRWPIPPTAGRPLRAQFSKNSRNLFSFA
jgi:hypothetical protein